MASDSYTDTVKWPGGSASGTPLTDHTLRSCAPARILMLVGGHDYAWVILAMSSAQVFECPSESPSLQFWKQPLETDGAGVQFQRSQDKKKSNS